MMVIIGKSWPVVPKVKSRESIGLGVGPFLTGGSVLRSEINDVMRHSCSRSIDHFPWLDYYCVLNGTTVVSPLYEVLYQVRNFATWIGVNMCIHYLCTKFSHVCKSFHPSMTDLHPARWTVEDSSSSSSKFHTIKSIVWIREARKRPGQSPQ